MQRFYDPETKGFYRDDVHTVIPASALKISAEEHELLVTAVNDGKTIKVSRNKPVIADPLPVTSDQRKSVAEIINDLFISGRNRAMTIKVGLLDFVVWRGLIPEEQSMFANTMSSSVTSLNDKLKKDLKLANGKLVDLVKANAAALEKVKQAKTNDELSACVYNFEQEVSQICSRTSH